VFCDTPTEQSDWDSVCPNSYVSTEKQNVCDGQATDGVAAEMRWAESLYERGQFASCLEVLDRVLSRDPKRRSALILTAFCYLYSYQLEAAEQVFLDLVKSKPEEASAFIGLALTYHKLGAEKQYRLILNVLKQRFPEAYANGRPWPE
jgi:Tfp pilus assembly protein PilF